MADKQKIVKDINKYIKLIHNTPKAKAKYTDLYQKYGVGINLNTGDITKHITSRQAVQDIEILTDIIIISLLEE